MRYREVIISLKLYSMLGFKFRLLGIRDGVYDYVFWCVGILFS